MAENMETQIDSPLPRQVADTYVDVLTELNPIKDTFGYLSGVA
ncbi:hypothetical protein [Streptomyces sp. yara]